MIEIDHANKLLETFDCQGLRELLNSLNLAGKRASTMAADVMSKKINFLNPKNTLGLIDYQAMVL